MIKRLLVLSLVLILPFLVFTPTSYAQSNLNQGKSILLPADQTINSDYFAAGDKVTVSGTVNGDAYVAGGNLLIDGTINGDLLIAGGNITITGPVNGNVRVAGGDLSVSGPISGSMTAMGGSINLSPTATVGKGLVIAGGNAQIMAPVNGGITAGIGQLVLGNSVGGDVNLGVGNLDLTSQAFVDGNLNYWSENIATFPESASISGQIVHHTPPPAVKENQEKAERGLASIITGFRIISFLSALLIGLLFLRFVPNFSGTIAQRVQHEPFLSLGIGLLVLILTPIIAVILMITLIGFPIGVMLLIWYIVALYLVKIFVGLALGNLIIEKFNKRLNIYLAFSIGLLLVFVLSWLPVVGVLIYFVMILLGLGSLFLAKKDFYQLLTHKKNI